MPEKAIVFDVDGVIIDSTTTKMQAFKNVASNYISDTSLVDTLIAQGVNRTKFAQIISQIVPEIPAEKIVLEITKQLAIYEQGPGYGNMSDTLDFITDHAGDFVYFTNTSMHKQSVVDLFNRLKITPYFMELLAYDTGTKRENIEYIMQVYNLKPENILFIDDNIHNINAVSPTGVHTLLFEQDGVSLDNKISNIFGE